MATYKVIQDIEAEDKFVGPLTLKQFIFFMVGLFFGWLNVFAYTRGFPWAMALFLPLALFSIFMAIPWNSNQPTDIWILAKIRFFFKPKARIWDQAGMQELVTITAPKKIERPPVKDFTENEFNSRLKALADTIDSRGWAVKHASVSEALLYAQPASDRLVSPDILPQQVPIENIDVIPDMMDDTRLDNMLNRRDNLNKTEAIEKMDRVRQGEPLENIKKPEVLIAPPDEQSDMTPLDPQQEAALSEQIRLKRTAGDVAYDHMSKLPSGGSYQPAVISAQSDDDNDSDEDSSGSAAKSKKQKAKTEVKKAQASVTEGVSPDILSLAQNNDLNVATIARQAKQDESDDGEVVISLH